MPLYKTECIYLKNIMYRYVWKFEINIIGYTYYTITIFKYLINFGV